MFTVEKMTLKLENDGIVEIDFSNPNSPMVSSTVSLTQEERAKIAFCLGLFYGAGKKALNEMNI